MSKVCTHAAIAAAAITALSACNSSSSPAPAPSVANISGDYAGTMTDAQGGAGTATATLAQHGASAGGAITDVQASGTITAQISLAITPSNALSGAMVVDYPNGTTCTFSTAGTYSNGASATPQISGSYTAVTNCNGDTGTYTLTQQCVDTVADRRVLFPATC